MDMDLLTLELKLAFRETGCPICRLRHKAAQRYIHSILWENVNDADTRVYLVRALGFCHIHAWQFQKMEEAVWADGLGTGIIYEDLTGRALAGLESYVEEQEKRVSRRRAQSGWWRRWVARFSTWWGQWFPRPITHSYQKLPSGLIPQARCRVCEMSELSEISYLSWLVRGCAEAEFRQWYQASDGLCLPHLRRALAMAEEEEPEAALFLARTSHDKVARLRADLQEYVRKHAWEFRDEPKLPGEQSSWVRAVAFFAGEWPEVAEHERPANS